jgi:hypothetical protein
MFRASQRPSSGVPKTVSAVSGIGHGIGTATSFHRGLIRTVVISKTVKITPFDIFSVIFYTVSGRK